MMLACKSQVDKLVILDLSEVVLLVLHREKY